MQEHQPNPPEVIDDTSPTHQRSLMTPAQPTRGHWWHQPNPPEVIDDTSPTHQRSLMTPAQPTRGHWWHQPNPPEVIDDTSPTHQRSLMTPAQPTRGHWWHQSNPPEVIDELLESQAKASFLHSELPRSQDCPPGMPNKEGHSLTCPTINSDLTSWGRRAEASLSNQACHQWTQVLIQSSFPRQQTIPSWKQTISTDNRLPLLVTLLIVILACKERRVKSCHATSKKSWERSC